jgi:inosine-uridine nucleoside N-ribohydrolase
MPERWLIIDTDAGVDDAVALTMAIKLGAEFNSVVKMISTSHGNCSENQVLQNVSKCLHSTGAGDIKVVRGASKPLVCDSIDASYFHGMDGFGDVSEEVLAYPHGYQESINISNEDVPSAIIKLCVEAKASPTLVEVCMITLGPLTNLAMTFEAIENDASISHTSHELLSEVYIMGGSSNGRGNVTRTAEFNLYADPEAAELTFQTFNKKFPNNKVKIISWDLCVHNAIPWAVYDELTRRHDMQYREKMTEIGIFLRSICKLSYVDKRGGNDEDSHGNTDENCGKRGNGAVICDMVAVAVALNYSSLVTSVEKCHIDVELHGIHTRGATICDYGHCYDQANRDRRILWINKCDPKILGEMFEKLFS